MIKLFSFEHTPREIADILEEKERQTVIRVLTILRQKYTNSNDFVMSHQEVFDIYEINPNLIR